LRYSFGLFFFSFYLTFFFVFFVFFECRYMIMMVIPGPLDSLLVLESHFASVHLASSHLLIFSEAPARTRTIGIDNFDAPSRIPHDRIEKGRNYSHSHRLGLLNGDKAVDGLSGGCDCRYVGITGLLTSQTRST